MAAKGGRKTSIRIIYKLEQIWLKNIFCDTLRQSQKYTPQQNGVAYFLKILSR
jgi:hypothetical protein